MKRFWSFCTALYHKHTVATSVLLIVGFIFFANFAYVFITNPDPLLSRSALPVQNGGKFMPLPFDGGNSIEGNDGLTKQALGIQSVHQLLSGNLPLWNHYEGIGAPLLGETQSAAWFPFTLILGLPYGFFLNQFVLEVLAGVGMYLFVRSLENKSSRKVGNAAAIVAGCLFATLGTYMMMPSAGFNPIPFLPWCMLGVASIFSSSKRFLDKSNIIAMLIFSLSVAFSLLAGFPETAALNLLLVGIYTIVLFVKTKRSEKKVRAFSVILAGVVALLLALPWLLEFFVYTNPANGSSGIHNKPVLLDLTNGASLSVAYLASFIPNAIGFTSSNPVYGGIGGFFTVSTLVLAILAMFNKNIALKWKLLFGGWFLFGWMRVIGVPIVTAIVAHIPVIQHASILRYIIPSLSFCLIILAVLYVDSIKNNSREKSKIFIGVVAFTILFYGFMIYGARHYIVDFITENTRNTLFSVFFFELSVIVSAAILILLFVKWKHKKAFIYTLLVLESIMCFSIWHFGAYSKGSVVDTRSMQFLQQNLGNQRFDSNMLNANYGSYFDIAQLSMRDLPIPTLWHEYITENFEAFDPSIGFLSNVYDANRIEQDEKMGVKYMHVVKGSLSDDIIQQRHLKKVYADQSTEVFELPGYRHYLSGDGCSVTKEMGFDRFVVDCARDSSLRRLEVFYPGWHASVDGSEVTISKAENLFQKIDIPQGKHTVEFYYWPKHMTASLVLFGLGVTSLLVAGVYLISDKLKATPKRWYKFIGYQRRPR